MIYMLHKHNQWGTSQLSSTASTCILPPRIEVVWRDGGGNQGKRERRKENMFLEK